jgi:hypothetical protein
MSSNGMSDVGYEYLNIDGGWWNGSDTGHIGRNATGYFEYNSKKFPHGIKKMIDYVHSKVGWRSLVFVWTLILACCTGTQVWALYRLWSEGVQQGCTNESRL